MRPYLIRGKTEYRRQPTDHRLNDVVHRGLAGPAREAITLSGIFACP